MEGVGHRRWRREKRDRKPKENRGDTAFLCITVVWDKQKTTRAPFALNKGHECLNCNKNSNTLPEGFLCLQSSKQRLREDALAIWGSASAAYRQVLEKGHTKVAALRRGGPTGVQTAELLTECCHLLPVAQKAQEHQQQSTIPVLIREGRSKERSRSATDPLLLIFI